MVIKMANAADITAYADDATTLYTFKPLSRGPGIQEYIESSVTKSMNALARIRLTDATQKNKLLRRQKQTVLPVMEAIGSSGTQEGYVAPPKVAHEVIVQTTVICSARATPTDIAHALKIHQSTVVSDTGLAGNAWTYRDITGQTGDVLVRGFMPS